MQNYTNNNQLAKICSERFFAKEADDCARKPCANTHFNGASSDAASSNAVGASMQTLGCLVLI